MKTLLKTVALASAGAMAIGAAQAGDKAEAKEKLRTWYGDVMAQFVACDTSSYGKYSAEGHRGYYPDSSELNDENTEEDNQREVAFCENGGNNDLTYEIADIVMLKDAALILGSGHYTRTEPGGEVSIDSDYTFTEVVVKTGHGWKFKHSHIGVVMNMNGEAGEESAG